MISLKVRVHFPGIDHEGLVLYIFRIFFKVFLLWLDLLLFYNSISIIYVYTDK